MFDSTKTNEKREFHNKTITADVIVTGAGIAGISAALSAAREGKDTVLITDRPVLGGSASSEIRVGPGGAECQVWNRYARETGIVEEIFNHIYYKAQNAGKWRWFYFDNIYFDIVLSQPNLRVYLNTSIFKAETDENNIKSISGVQLRAETIYTFNGKVFIDCTGDGTIGFLTGAHYRVGREGKEEFKEFRAPEVPDLGTMGATLLFTTKICDKPVVYKAPAWAIQVRELPTFGRIQKYIGKMPDGSFYGFWWVEYGGQLDSIHDDGEILLHLRKLVAGLWDYVKNSGDFPETEKHEINWIGYLAGKRESRRLMGPYIATSDDFKGQKHFDDAIGYAGWPIDIHPYEGYLSMDEGCGCTHDNLAGPTDIPFRCIYSVNINNLLFAGRHPSCTHEALGTLRLIPTTGEMGQAAGIAASICIEKNCTPDDIYKADIPELQRRILRTDGSILGRKLIEKEDFSRTAKVTASTEAKLENINTEHFKFIKEPTGLIMPAKTEFEGIYLYLSADQPTEAVADFYISDGVPQNYRVNKLIATAKCTINKAGWYWFEANLKAVEGGKVFIMVHPNSNIKMYFSYNRLTGVLGITNKEIELNYNSWYNVINEGQFINQLPCFKLKNSQGFYCAANVKNGFNRIFNELNLWRSEEFCGHKPETLRLDFAGIQTIKRVELVFNSDLNHKRLQPSVDAVNAELIKEYELYAITEDGEKLIYADNDNFKRFITLDFEPIHATGIVLKVYKTWGLPNAEVFDIRIY